MSPNIKKWLGIGFVIGILLLGRIFLATTNVPSLSPPIRPSPAPQETRNASNLIVQGPPQFSPPPPPAENNAANNTILEQ